MLVHSKLTERCRRYSNTNKVETTSKSSLCASFSVPIFFSALLSVFHPNHLSPHTVLWTDIHNHVRLSWPHCPIRLICAQMYRRGLAYTVTATLIGSARVGLVLLKTWATSAIQRQVPHQLSPLLTCKILFFVFSSFFEIVCHTRIKHSSWQ